MDNDRVIDPMIYDALLELATRIGGRYNAWADQASNEGVREHWRNAGIQLRQQVREVDPMSRTSIEAKRTELRALWSTMPVEAPNIAA